jgi:hypothetical protein
MGLNNARAFVATLAFAAFAALLVNIAPAQAGTCTVSNLPTSGTLTGTRLNGKFTQVENCINGNITNSNLSSTASVANSKLANPNNTYAVGFSYDACGTSADVVQFRAPASSTITGVSARCLGCSAADHDVDLEKNGTPIKAFTTIADTTTQTDFTLATSVGNTDDISFDLTQNTAGSCAGWSFVVYLKTAHVS